MPIILGIDEVGRGPWAGPLVVGAVILSTDDNNPAASTNPTAPNHPTALTNLTDSKKLTPKKRASLAPLIEKSAAATGLGWVSAAELDEYGLSASLKLATRRAVKKILAKKAPFSEIIIDGTVNFLADTLLADRVSLLKKADSLVREVSAASIIAKVARDDYMLKIAEKYPEYGFENHVGYGTAAHRAALLEYGTCPEHRKSFRPIRELTLDRTAPTASHPTAPNPAPAAPRPHICQNSAAPRSTTNQTPAAKNTTTKGKIAENLVADYLKSRGHEIIAHNFKTKSYEIDLISIKDNKIYFTEVKYRTNPEHGSALAQITPAKQHKMRYAAEKFLSQLPTLADSHSATTANSHSATTANSHSATPASSQLPAPADLKSLQPLLAAAAVEGQPPRLKTWFPLET